jgi:hypothetical protein
MAKKKEVRLKKIPLEIFLKTLEELYLFGLDYIDIIGTPGEEQDVIGIVYSLDYMSKELHDRVDESLDEFIKDEEENQYKKDIKLSDDDLNQII